MGPGTLYNFMYTGETADAQAINKGLLRGEILVKVKVYHHAYVYILQLTYSYRHFGPFSWTKLGDGHRRGG